jgi:hypothetical protein
LLTKYRSSNKSYAGKPGRKLCAEGSGIFSWNSSTARDGTQGALSHERGATIWNESDERHRGTDRENSYFARRRYWLAGLLESFLTILFRPIPFFMVVDSFVYLTRSLSVKVSALKFL